MSIVDAIIAYKFVTIISTPWKQMEAYKKGIIDANGNILIPRSKLKGDQVGAYPSVFYTLCWNIKRILTKLGLGTNIGSFISALYLLREKIKEIKESNSVWERIQVEALQILEEHGLSDQVKILRESNESVMYPGTYRIGYETIVVESPTLPHGTCMGIPVFKIGKRVTNLIEAKKVDEDGVGGGVPANNVGGGAIAGVSPGQEPPGPKGGYKALKKKRKKQMEKDSETINIVGPLNRRGES